MACGLVAAALTLALLHGASSQDVNAPPFKPPETIKPWNTWEIPRLPDRFAVQMKRSSPTEATRPGRWVFDHEMMRMLLEYEYDEGLVKGFFFDFNLDKLKAYKYSFGGNQNPQCITYDLEGSEFAKMPSTFFYRNVDVQEVEHGTTTGFESDRENAIVSMRGKYNKTTITATMATNGRLVSCSLDSSRWTFQPLRDYSDLDNFAAAKNKDLQSAKKPALECTNAGQITWEYIGEIQPYVPVMLKKPKADLQPNRDAQGDKKAMRFFERSLQPESEPEAAVLYDYLTGRPIGMP